MHGYEESFKKGNLTSVIVIQPAFLKAGNRSRRFLASSDRISGVEELPFFFAVIPNPLQQIFAGLSIQQVEPWLMVIGDWLSSLAVVSDLARRVVNRTPVFALLLFRRDTLHSALPVCG